MENMQTCLSLFSFKEGSIAKKGGKSEYAYSEALKENELSCVL